MTNVKKATIVFAWEGNILITAPCKVNTKTKFIYDIDKNDYEGDENALRVLEKSYVIIDGKEYAANFVNISENVSEYYYTNSSYLFEIKLITDIIKQEDIDLDNKLYNCDLLYMVAIADVLDLPTPEDSSDTQMFW